MLFCSRFTIQSSSAGTRSDEAKYIVFPPAPQVPSPGLYPSTSATTKQVRVPRWNNDKTRHLLCIWGDEYATIDKQRNAKELDNICKCINKILSEHGMKTFRTVYQCKARKRYFLYVYKKITKPAQMPKPRSLGPFSYVSVSKANKQAPDWSIQTTAWLILSCVDNKKIITCINNFSGAHLACYQLHRLNTANTGISLVVW